MNDRLLPQEPRPCTECTYCYKPLIGKRLCTRHSLGNKDRVTGMVNPLPCEFIRGATRCDGINNFYKKENNSTVPVSLGFAISWTLIMAFLWGAIGYSIGYSIGYGQSNTDRIFEANTKIINSNTINTNSIPHQIKIIDGKLE